MNSIDASHLEVIKQYLEDNPQTGFRMRKWQGQWHLGTYDFFDDFHDELRVTESSFTEAIKQMSIKLGESNGSIG